MGSVRAVVLEADAHYACLTHALSNEEEEVMGLCIGDVVETEAGCDVYVTATMSLRRLDKRKDRVEISVEQLSNASTKVEEMSLLHGKRMRIVGWYHSHPKITVWPSHVDTDTQAVYQMMDETFVGLIFSCFNEDKSSFEHSVHVTCFQSVPASHQSTVRHDSIAIPIIITHGTETRLQNSVALKELPKIIMQEECDMFRKANSCETDFMTTLHNSSVHVQALSKLNSHFLLPLLKVTARSNLIAKKRLADVAQENDKLKRKVSELQAKMNELQRGGE